MPKIIENVKDNILAVSKEIIEKESFENLTIRKVSNQTGYAIGTIYNYFPNKISILAAIMLEEWQKDEVILLENIQKSPAFRDSIEAIYNEINDFFLKRKELFYSVNIPKESRNKIGFGHNMFLSAIRRYISLALNKFDCHPADDELNAACILLIQAPTVYGASFESIYSSLNKLLIGGK